MRCGEEPPCGGSDLQVDHVVLQRVAPRGVGDGLAVAVVAVLRDVHLVLADAVEGQQRVEGALEVL